MVEDPLKAYVDASGINGQVFEALQRGGLESLISGLLSGMNPDSPLATLMRFMFPENHAMLAENYALSSGTTGQDEGNGRLAAARATLCRVAGRLGACSICCGVGGG